MTLFDSEFNLKKVASEIIRAAVRDKIFKIAPERYLEIGRLDIVPQSGRKLRLNLCLYTPDPEDSNRYQHCYIDLVDIISDHIVDLLLRSEEDSKEQGD